MGNESQQTPAQQVRADRLKIVLNGGSNIMEQATIPIRWFFDDELLARKPKHVIIIEQDESEIQDPRSSDLGARYKCRVIDSVKFLQVFSPGRHRIIVLVLDGSPHTKSYMHREDRRAWAMSIPVADVERAIRLNRFHDIGPDVIGASIAEVEVPPELFAKRSQTALGKAMWNWINLWYKENPHDQCAYRKRWLFAFTLKPFAWLALKIATFAGKVIASVVYPLMRAVIFMFGYRPVPLFSRISNIWEYNLFDLPVCSKEGGGRYRVWQVDRDGFAQTYMPVTVMEVLGAVSVCWLSWRYITWQASLLIVLSFVIAALLTLFAYRFTKVTVNEADDTKFKALSETEQNERWLRQLSLKHATKAVDLKTIPVPLEGRLTHRFRVGYWSLKTKVCRPFAR